MDLKNIESFLKEAKKVGAISKKIKPIERKLSKASDSYKTGSKPFNAYEADEETMGDMQLWIDKIESNYISGKKEIAINWTRGKKTREEEKKEEGNNIF